MEWFAIAFVAGALLSAPVIPLLRGTDPMFGRAAAGITAVAVLMFAVRVALELDDHDEVSFQNVVATAFDGLLVVKSVFAFAVAVAIAGMFVRRRA